MFEHDLPRDGMFRQIPYPSGLRTVVIVIIIDKSI